MRKNKSFAQRLAVTSTAVAGAIIFSIGLYLHQWSDAQYALYNRGIAAYRANDMQVAIKFADQSLSLYKSRRAASWPERFIYPRPDKELAAQAAFLKGKALLRSNQPSAAVQSFKESLELNSGNLYLGRHLSEEEFHRYYEAAMVTKYDLELVFKNNPPQAKKQGKGKPQDKGGQGTTPVPGEDPSTQPGKGRRDTI
ncbi:MAG: tetratricopeptide repeat protein [Cyanobacteria bacterium SZAS LIN-2]|nr:tetratricopeptide repeat protein [Cyanobacteria bacterium SZAS LIN-2]